MAVRKRFDVAARKSTVTGAELGERLRASNMPVKVFAEIFGVPLSALHRMIETTPHMAIPRLIELSLVYAEQHGDELRHWPVPRVSRTNRTGYRISEADGAEIDRRLRQISWTVADFARLTGLTDRWLRSVTRGEQDGAILYLLDRALELVEWHPLELQAWSVVQTPQRSSRARREALSCSRKLSPDQMLMPGREGD